MIRGAPFGKRFSEATLDSYRVMATNETAFEACKRLASGESEGVILHGPEGVGKTHLLVGLARAFVDAGTPPSIETSDDGALKRLPPLRELIEGCSSEEDSPEIPTLTPGESYVQRVVEYWPILDLVSELRAEAIRGELELSYRCRTCDLLVLDDLGREKLTEFIQQEFQRIIDWRYRDMKALAVATNLLPRQIETRYDPHTISRWKESCEFVKVEGPDYRERRKDSA